MARQTSLKMTLRLDGARNTLNKFRDLPKDAADQLRDRSQKLANTLVGKIRQAAESDQSPQAALFAPTVRPKRDRVPAIQAGGAKRVGRNSVPVWAILFGAEFGSDRFPQFRKVSHSAGPMFGVVEREQKQISDAWNEAADQIVAQFTSGGDR